MKSPVTLHRTPRPVKGDPNWQAKERKIAADERKREKRDQKVVLSAESLANLMSCIKNTGRSFQWIEDQGGPCVATLLRWEENKVTFARNETMLLAAKVCGIRQEWRVK